MNPICITNSGTKIYRESPGLMTGSETFKTEVQGRTQRVTKVGLIREQIEAIIAKEGIKSGNLNPKI